MAQFVIKFIWACLSNQPVLVGADQNLTFLGNLSCRCPPQPNPSIPDQNTGQGMPREHTEGPLALRWWPESVFPGFPEMLFHFFPANRPTHQVLWGQTFTPFLCFDGYGLTLNLLGDKRNGEIWTRTRISYSHATFILAGTWHKSSPPLKPLTPNVFIFMQKCYDYV